MRSGGGARAAGMHIISTTDLMGTEWTFLQSLCPEGDLTFETRSGLPRNALERRIRRPAIAHWRGAMEAALSARRRKNAVLASHLPEMAAATNIMRRRICPRVPQIAFAFNFTDLPQGERLAFFRDGLRGIDEFVVHSRYERELYAEAFDLPEERFRFVPWAMGTPGRTPDLKPGMVPSTDYFAAIGGEGRDYRLLAQVMRSRPALQAVIVARPYSVAGIDFPANVRVFTNLPGPDTWRIANESRGMIVPLKSDRTACGHITLVGSQLLGLPLVITQSRGVSDYVADGETARVVPAGDAAAMGAALDWIVANPAEAAAMADKARLKAATRSSRAIWLAYFRDLKVRLGR